MYTEDCIVLETPDPTIEFLTGRKYSYAVCVLFKGNITVYATKLDKLDKESLFKGWREMKLPPKIGLNLSALNTKTYIDLSKRFSVIDVSNKIRDFRRHKTIEQANCVEKAARCTDLILQRFCLLPKGKIESELDARLWIEREIYLRGMEPAYPVIVASGKNSGIPHHTPTTELNSGPVLIDAGARYNGYCSDMTRMYDNGMDLDQKKKYAYLLGIQNHTIRMVKKDVPYKELHNYVVRSLGDDADFFTHSLGHGVGIEVHESPRVSKGSNDIVQLGDIFTIEPGLYYQNYGLRIEDTLYYDGETRVLTNHSKELRPLFKP